MTAFGSEIMKQEIERQFHISLKQIPLSADAFSVDIRTMEWFADIFSKKGEQAVFHKVLQDVCHENLFG